MIFLDKALGLYEDLREYCADMASDSDASYVWAQYAELLDGDIARTKASLRAYAAEADGDESPTWFERIKRCETPEEMAAALCGAGRMFCPHPRDSCGVFAFGENCHHCAAMWLREKVKA